jgi:hypothetical protein
VAEPYCKKARKVTGAPPRRQPAGVDLVTAVELETPR